MLKGGVISKSYLLACLGGEVWCRGRGCADPPALLALPFAVDVINADEARLAEAAGACAVMVSTIMEGQTLPRRAAS